MRRNERLVVLNGPAVMKQGARELSAEKISMNLDSTFHAQHLTAEGHPVVESAENGATLNVAAEKFEGFLSPAGWMQRIVAAGNVNGSRAAKTGTDHFTAAQVEIAMQPERNLVREMTVKGGVTMDSRQDSASRSLKTEALLVKFGAGAQPDQQKIESAETLAPATIETKTSDETTQLRARKFVTQFGPTGRLEKLIGHSAVEVRREIGKGAPQTSSSEELAATFGANGEWETLDQSGNVRFQQGDKRATAQQAKIVRTTDLIALQGSPVISDATSRTSAGSVTINQKSGAITATDNVISTYFSSTQSGGVNLGTGPAHISADALAGSTTSGHLFYTGRARLWQGESVLNANQIEVWRDDKKLEATGNVIAVFPQSASSSMGGGFGMATAKPGGKSLAATPGSQPNPASSKASPTVWVIHAPSLTYWDDQSKARLDGGVIATSQQGELTSKTLDAYLGLQPPLARGQRQPPLRSRQRRFRRPPAHPHRCPRAGGRPTRRPPGHCAGGDLHRRGPEIRPFRRRTHDY